MENKIYIGIDPSGTGKTGIYIDNGKNKVVDTIKRTNAIDMFIKLETALDRVLEIRQDNQLIEIYIESILPNFKARVSKDMIELAKLIGMLESYLQGKEKVIYTYWIRAKDTKAMSKAVWSNKDYEVRVDRKKQVHYDGLVFKNQHELDAYCIYKIGSSKNGKK